jgi:steroid 5-alpha reductase family enzyme
MPVDLGVEMLSPFWAGLGVSLALFTLAWLVHLSLRDASIVDPLWGPAFFVVAGAYAALTAGAGPRRVLLLVLLGLWAARLGGYLSWRKWGEPEDHRYAAMRERWGERRFPWLSLPIVFWLQAVILWVVSWPLFQALRAERPVGLTWLDGVGVLLFGVGFFFETVGDWQLARFKGDPTNRGRVMDRGLWRYTRHPNYFGECVLWWGFGLIALATGPADAWWTLVSPVLMTFLLLKVSGVSLLEQSLNERRPAYREYVRRTNAFFPGPPRG